MIYDYAVILCITKLFLALYKILKVLYMIHFHIIMIKGLVKYLGSNGRMGARSWEGESIYSRPLRLSLFLSRTKLQSCTVCKFKMFESQALTPAPEVAPAPLIQLGEREMRAQSNGRYKGGGTDGGNPLVITTFS